MTFSIAARCPRSGMLGVAVSTAVPAVGAQVVGEVHPVDHDLHQVQLTEVGCEQVGQCVLGHRHELA
jgi:uncharacterized Ntn-hydrolase superfamily protein